MARPKDAASEETWNKIVAAARDELGQDSSRGVDLSMRQIAARSGVSLGTIHYYFPTKDALLEGVLDAYHAALGTLAETMTRELAALTRENARAVIGRCLRQVYRFARSERRMLKLTAFTNTQRGHIHPQRASRVHGPHLDLFSNLLAPFVDTDAFGVRMAFQTMTFVVMQYVLMADAEREQLVGTNDTRAEAQIEEHIVSVGLRLIFEG
jgi:AcrR family transcriptional regulator